MRALVGIAGTGVAATLHAPARSVAILAGLLAVLVPYQTGLGLSHGIQREAEESVRFGADLYVTGSQFGRDVPVPVAAAAAVRGVDGVTAVVPRVVGAIALGKDAEPAVLVGLPPDHFPAGIECVDGRLPASGGANELVVGTELAHRLRLKVGDVLPPFYHSRSGERLSRVVGLFKSDVCLWQARLILTTFDTAAAIFDQRGLATDLLVSCRPGYEDRVRKGIRESVRLSAPDAAGAIEPRVTTRTDLEILLPRGLGHREGVFNLLFVFAFAVGMLVVLVASGVGASGRRREVGLLKATGWQTDEVLLRAAVESLVLALTAASVSILLAYLWLGVLNGYGIAGVFLAGVGESPTFQIPYRLTPIPALLGFLIALVMVMVGTLYPTWRAATVLPVEALRSTR